MKMISRIAASVTGVLIASGCYASATETTTQVIYRYDDHRYLELKGINCEGALWYTDTKRRNKTIIYFDRYRPFNQIYINPSDSYIVVPDLDGIGQMVSKDYGKTWDVAYMVGGSIINNTEINSIVVADNRAYLLAKDERFYVSSAPFDDPRMMSGGSGIDYTNDDGEKRHIDSGSYAGWGLAFANIDYVNIYANKYFSNWQNLPKKSPVVKSYQGWDHMKCNPDL
ncbi:hypothetical protein CWS43_12085 [Rahnella sp. AA]|uniref:T6SS immunity protein Tli3 family protein n=1 Tax=Rahnella sp. AA TaxID=2057180 RepID=UPI000C3348EF|nr:hypothetical protein [Rahnella sp. AA]PKE30358.1 hypothetical protein CWS43_12085 [Rahnella sp. AA]